MTERWRLAAAAVAMSLGAVGCTNAKFISASTGGPGQVKFFYVDQLGDSGLVRCDRADDGTLSGCRRQRLVIQGEDR